MSLHHIKTSLFPKILILILSVGLCTFGCEEEDIEVANSYYLDEDFNSDSPVGAIEFRVFSTSHTFYEDFAEIRVARQSKLARVRIVNEPFVRFNNIPPGDYRYEIDDWMFSGDSFSVSSSVGFGTGGIWASTGSTFYTGPHYTLRDYVDNAEVVANKVLIIEIFL